MAIPVKATDKLIILLEYADDRMEVHVDGGLVDSLDVGQPKKTHDLMLDIKTPGIHRVQVLGLDYQIPHRSLGFQVIKNNTDIVWQDHKEETNGPGDDQPHHNWYVGENQFEVT